MENPVDEIELEVILEDETIDEARFVEYLRNYNREYGWEWQGRRRENTPFSILVNNNGTLRDIDELWQRTNGLDYLSRLLDDNQEMINLIYERTPRGIDGFRYVLKFLFLYNMSRIHKIAERDEFGPIYQEEANDIFQHVNAGNIIYQQNQNFTNYDIHLINIMTDEAIACVPDNLHPDANNIHPFDGRSVLPEETGLFFRIFKGQFHLFVNRVSLRYYKALRRFRLRAPPVLRPDIQHARQFGHLAQGGKILRQKALKSINKISIRKYLSNKKSTLKYGNNLLDNVKLFKIYTLRYSIILPPDVKYLKSKSSSRTKNTNKELSNLISKTSKNREYNRSMKEIIDNFKVIDNSYTLNRPESGKEVLLLKKKLDLIKGGTIRK